LAIQLAVNCLATGFILFHRRIIGERGVHESFNGIAADLHYLGLSHGVAAHDLEL
jgi:hypothetical protein